MRIRDVINIPQSPVTDQVSANVAGFVNNVILRDLATAQAKEIAAQDTVIANLIAKLEAYGLAAA
jgi:hypothetical protein